MEDDAMEVVEGGGGVKYDDNKPRYDLIPPEFEEAIAVILTMGAEKYADRNWEAGMRWGRVYASLRRHLASWQLGEEKDADSGKSHLWHAGCCIAFLITYEARGIGVDDRPCWDGTR